MIIMLLWIQYDSYTITRSGKAIFDGFRLCTGAANPLMLIKAHEHKFGRVTPQIGNGRVKTVKC